MAETCSNTKRFESLELAVDAMHEIAKEAAATSRRSAEAQEGLAKEMRQVLYQIRDTTARDNERLNRQGKDIDVLFQEKRKLDERVIPEIKAEIQAQEKDLGLKIDRVKTDMDQRFIPIEARHFKDDGKLAAFKDFRVMVPSAIAAMLGISNLWDKVHGWLVSWLK